MEMRSPRPAPEAEPFCEPELPFEAFLLGFTISHRAPQFAVGRSTFLGGVVRVSFRGGRSGTGRGGKGGGMAGVVVPLVLKMAVG